MLERYKYRLLTKTSVANLDIPIYELDYHGRKLAVLMLMLVLLAVLPFWKT